MIRNMLVKQARNRLADRRGGRDAIGFAISEEIAWAGNTHKEMLDLNRDLRFITGG